MGLGSRIPSSSVGLGSEPGRGIVRRSVTRGPARRAGIELRAQRTTRVLATLALIGALALLTGCATTTPKASGPNSIENGVKIPNAAGDTTAVTTSKVNVASVTPTVPAR